MNPLLANFLSVSSFHTVVFDDGANTESPLKTGFFVGRSIAFFSAVKENQAINEFTKWVFLGALKQQYDSTIADSLLSKLDIPTAKPLSGRLIRAVVTDAEEHAKALVFTTARAVSAFFWNPNGASRLLMGYSDQGWLGCADANYFKQVLTVEAVKYKRPFSQAEIKGLAESTLDRIRMLERQIQADYNGLSLRFQSNDHGLLLSALDQLADHVQLRVRLDISGTSSTGSEIGAGDKEKCQRIMAALIKQHSFDDKRSLFESIITHPTSKEIIQLLGSGRTEFSLKAVERANIHEDDKVAVLDTFCRTATTLAALLFELDKAISDKIQISPRLKGWLNERTGELTSGRIEYADPVFAKAFIDLQRNRIGAVIDSYGLSNIKPGTYCKQYLMINADDAFQDHLAALSSRQRQVMDDQYKLDFNRATYYVDGKQVNQLVDEAKNDIMAVPLIATRFAHHAIFAEALRLLRDETGFDFVYCDGPQKPVAFILQHLPNNDIQLHAHYQSPVKGVFKDGDLLLMDPKKSSMSIEIGILIQQEGSQSSGTLSSPITYEYCAVPPEASLATCLDYQQPSLANIYCPPLQIRRGRVTKALNAKINSKSSAKTKAVLTRSIKCAAGHN